MTSLRVLVVAAGIALGALALERWSSPFAWIGFIGFAVLVFLAWTSRHPRARVILFNLAFVPLAMGAFELYLGMQTQLRADPAIPKDRILRDDVVGYRLAPGTRVPEALWYGDEQVYAVVYTIDEKGLRIAPPHRAGAEGLCVLFFGGSFTFGTGIEDDETSPYQTGLFSGGRNRIYNFAYTGYGPHQMLAELQSGRVAESIDCEPTHVIYQSVHDHVRRVAGRASWDLHGPRFVFQEDGTLVRRGNFDDGPPRFEQAWPRLARSHALKILADDFEPGPRDYERFAAVVEASRDHLVSRYPGVRFQVLMWNKPWKQDPAFWGDLQRRGIPVRFIDQVLPGYPEEKEGYAIGPRDGHPNRRANELIAGWVVREVLGQAVVDGGG